jgi:Flp pilus assembly protein TadG
MTRSTFKSFRKADGGVAAVEFALIFPIMMGVYFGLMDMTGLISFNRKVTAVASATADLVGQNRNTILKTDLNDYFKVGKMIMSGESKNDVRVQVSAYRRNGTTISRIWTVNNSQGGACQNSPSTAEMADLMVAGNDLIVAQACLPYTPFIGPFLGDAMAAEFNVEQIITVRPRASLTLDCYLTEVGSTPCPV